MQQSSVELPTAPAPGAMRPPLSGGTASSGALQHGLIAGGGAGLSADGRGADMGVHGGVGSGQPGIVEDSR